MHKYCGTSAQDFYPQWMELHCSSSATGLLLNSPCLLENLVDSPQCSVVFSLEYVVTEPLMEEHMKLVHSMPRALNRVLLIRWCVWKPFDLTSSGQEMVGNLLNVPLFAGPCPNPDEVFVYKGPSTEMHDEHLARLAPGMIQFRVLLQEQGYDSSAGEDLTVKTENLTRQNVTGKPPLPSQSPRLQTNKSHLLQQIPPQQHQQLHSVPQQGVHVMAGYTAAAYPSTSPVMNMQQQPSFNVTPFTGVSQHQVTASKYPVAVVGQLAEQMGALTTTDLTELQYTPSHASVVVQVPQTDSTRSLSRASYTRLYNAGFTSLLDRNGDPPEVIDPEKEVKMLPLSKQIQDPLSCNEIVFQFLAFSKLLDYSSTDVGKGPSTMFFTFQFYKYPPLTTERLVLCKNSDKYKRKDQPALYILNKVNKDGTPLKTSPGYELRYFVDPCFLKPGEPLLFLQHLQQQTLHIDVWDGDSLLLIGSCSVPLKYACRNGHEAVQCTVELDVLNTEYDEDIDEISDDLGKLRGIQPYGVAAICKGQLHFRIANIGHPPTNPSESDPVITELPVKSHVIFSHLCGKSEFQGGSLVSGKKKVDGIKKRVARAGHLLNTHPELRTVIASPKTGVSSTMPSPRNGTKDENTDERKRKLARMEIVRDMLGTDKKAATFVVSIAPHPLFSFSPSFSILHNITLHYLFSFSPSFSILYNITLHYLFSFSPSFSILYNIPLHHHCFSFSPSFSILHNIPLHHLVSFSPSFFILHNIPLHPFLFSFSPSFSLLHNIALHHHLFSFSLSFSILYNIALHHCFSFSPSFSILHNITLHYLFSFSPSFSILYNIPLHHHCFSFSPSFSILHNIPLHHLVSFSLSFFILHNIPLHPFLFSFSPSFSILHNIPLHHHLFSFSPSFSILHNIPLHPLLFFSFTLFFTPLLRRV
ncbi:NPHP4 [Acanthosepion pharaonis]|uniref:NPHP4 n=1 Tax=Acanthosepion pharaonis TaxID=158019 RepID=A0A812CNI8_ACAPH|nr:NPHP4 [Sepia pharaonis]